MTLFVLKSTLWGVSITIFYEKPNIQTSSYPSPQPIFQVQLFQNMSSGYSPRRAHIPPKQAQCSGYSARYSTRHSTPFPPAGSTPINSSSSHTPTPIPQYPQYPPHPTISIPQYTPYPQAQYPQAQYPQAQYPQAQYPQAQYPQAQYPQAKYPHSYQSQEQHAPNPRDSQYSQCHNGEQCDSPERLTPREKIISYEDCGFEVEEVIDTEDEEDTEDEAEDAEDEEDAEDVEDADLKLESLNGFVRGQNPKGQIIMDEGGNLGSFQVNAIRQYDWIVVEYSAYCQFTTTYKGWIQGGKGVILEKFKTGDVRENGKIIKFLKDLKSKKKGAIPVWESTLETKIKDEDLINYVNSGDFNAKFGCSKNVYDMYVSWRNNRDMDRKKHQETTWWRKPLHIQNDPDTDPMLRAESESNSRGDSRSQGNCEKPATQSHIQPAQDPVDPETELLDNIQVEGPQPQYPIDCQYRYRWKDPKYPVLYGLKYTCKPPKCFLPHFTPGDDGDEAFTIEDGFQLGRYDKYSVSREDWALVEFKPFTKYVFQGKNLRSAGEVQSGKGIFYIGNGHPNEQGRDRTAFFTSEWYELQHCVKKPFNKEWTYNPTPTQAEVEQVAKDDQRFNGSVCCSQSILELYKSIKARMAYAETRLVTRARFL
ncbi:hypothetical protein P154DRAFT_568161 [Amniculicola lignicola CBS 123094]|uniref:Uncharacterized protein n=1 Tax=Amniculicola lignicola CBS 123094 TaxID=1392246 RepID=A0A6A5VWV9_9PLEO|nr:hypothetical protein P154DRAFT_568161 [Amniculicola lignicola CBS 123094]